MLEQNKELSGVRTAVSANSNAVEAARELADSLIHPALGSVLFFCSAEYDLEALASELESVFGTTPVTGCTTSGEITPDGYDQGCITAIGFNKNAFAVSIGLISRLESFDLIEAQKLIDELVIDCRSQAVAPIKGNTFAMTLLDGLSALEEQVLFTLSSVLGSIPSFGGSAGDDEHLAFTHVYYQGRFHNDAAVLVLINTACPFEVFTTHHMRETPEKLVVTDADADNRVVHELNAEPAAIAYSRATGIKIEEMDSTVFALNPLAVRIGDEYFVRSIQKVNPDFSLTFYCAIERGIVLTIMESTDMLEDLESQFINMNRHLGPRQITIGCDCFLRRLELEHRNEIEAASSLLRKHRVIGFNTYGEQLGGIYINQTFTGVAIGVCDNGK